MLSALAVGTATWGILGDRGSGKSSTLARLAADGYDVVSDDLLVIDGNAAFAGPWSLDLRPDAAARLDVGEDVGVLGARPRHRLVLPPLERRLVPTRWIVLACSEGDRVEVREIPPARDARAPRQACGAPRQAGCAAAPALARRATVHRAAAAANLAVTRRHGPRSRHRRRSRVSDPRVRARGAAGASRSRRAPPVPETAEPVDVDQCGVGPVSVPREREVAALTTGQHRAERRLVAARQHVAGKMVGEDLPHPLLAAREPRPPSEGGEERGREERVAIATSWSAAIAARLASPPIPVSSEPPRASASRGAWKWVLGGQSTPWRRSTAAATGPTASSSSLSSTRCQSRGPRCAMTRSCHAFS